MPESPVPCKYPPCVSFRSERSQFGYCVIHHQVATVMDLFKKALVGHISPALKEFAQALDKGLYPSFFR